MILLSASLIVIATIGMNGYATPEEHRSFISEKPPCAKSPLTEADVLSAAHADLGVVYELPGLREPRRVVTAQECVYEYRQFLVTEDPNDPLSKEPVVILLVNRDRGVIGVRPEGATPADAP